jgi:hypothetical protein
MGGTIMFKNVIIITLLWVILFDVSSKDFFGYMRKGLDKTQEIVYDIKRSTK